ncbi:hypothetical protein KAI46_03810 [bacterium]|nr:hypothetical protein [bacterium]
MRVGDLQQIMLQTDTVGKVQQQGAHGAEVEQSKLAAQHLVDAKQKEKQVQTTEDTVLIKDRDARRQQEQSQSNQDGTGSGSGESEDDNPAGEGTSQSLRYTGKHIDIKV